MHRINDRIQIQISRQQLEGGGRVPFFFQTEDQQPKGQVAIFSQIQGTGINNPPANLRQPKKIVSKFGFPLIYCWFVLGDNLQVS